MNKKNDQITLTNEGKTVRIINSRDGYLAVAADVAEYLGYKNGSTSASENVSDENKFKKQVFCGRQYRPTLTMNIEGINELISNCHLNRINSQIEWLRKELIVIMKALDGDINSMQKIILKKELAQINSQESIGIIEDLDQENDYLNRERKIAYKRMEELENEVDRLEGNLQDYRGTLGRHRENLVAHGDTIIDLYEGRCFLCRIKERLSLKR